MSVKSWKREFYRTPADKVSKRYALRHSLKKWIGLKPSNLKKHNVVIYDTCVMNKSDTTNDESDGNVDFLAIDDSSCALCKHYDPLDCNRCPLAQISARCTDLGSPFDLFLDDNWNVNPMVKALQKAVNKGKKK